MTVSRVIPEKVWEVFQVLQTYTHQPGLTTIQGLHQVLLIESQEEPGRLTLMTTWNTKAGSQAFLNSNRYAHLVAALQPYLLRQPEWYWYSVLEEWRNEVEQAQS
jgi:quinol monooxygenase YgiN